MDLADRPHPHLTGHDLLGSAQDTTNHYDPVTGDLLRATQAVNSPGLPAYDFAAPGLYESSCRAPRRRR